MDIRMFFNPVFWEKAWNHSAEENKRELAPEAIEHWNMRAKTYDKNVASASGSTRVQDALHFLDAFGVLNNKLRILDLGCGPGNFTLAFAMRGHDVVALDPAEEMINILSEKIAGKPDLASRITTVQADWIPLNLPDYGWAGHFDLVFASMTPGIHDPQTLKKAMQASKKYIYLSQFAGPRKQQSLDDLWLQLQGTPYFRPARDSLLPLVWLYTQGFRPVIHYSHWEREDKQGKAEAIAEITTMLSARMSVDDTVKQAIVDYVTARTDHEGFYKEKKGAASAMMLWDVGREYLTLGG